MAIAQVVLDTDILSVIMRQNHVVVPKAREYLAEQGRFTFSIITRYEILRGLKAKGAIAQGAPPKAIAQMTAFDNFCTKNIILPLTDDVGAGLADNS